MSTELETLSSNVNNHVQVTSFSGGPIRGRCIQLTQSGTEGIHNVQLTQAQVVQQIKVMTDWLANK